MGRRIAWLAGTVVGAALVVGSMLPTQALASGGGGCGRPVTDAHGTHVRIKQFCFTPTVLHVALGRPVTFTNIDPFAHTVSGANVVWGSFDGLGFDTSVTYRFVKPGVYPYFCAYHPGMVGAIVAGNGGGRGDAKVTTTQRGPVILVDRSARVPHVRAARAGLAVGPDAGGSSLPLPVAVLVGVGLFAVAGIALLQLRQQMKE